MDFVIAGFGLGSLLLLLGLAARDLGPRLAPQVRASSSLTSDASFKPRDVDLWRRLVPLAGPTVMIGGAAVIAATIAGIFLQLSDHAGSRLVFFTMIGALLLVAIRLPFLARGKTVVKLPAQPRRSAPPPRRRPQQARPSLPTNGRAKSEEFSRKLREPREAPVKRQPATFVEPEPAPPTQTFPDLPDFFNSDEPIQTGLLERLLAEDTVARQQTNDVAINTNEVVAEPPTESPPPSGSTAPGRPIA